MINHFSTDPSTAYGRFCTIGGRVTAGFAQATAGFAQAIRVKEGISGPKPQGVVCIHRGYTCRILGLMHMHVKLYMGSGSWPCLLSGFRSDQVQRGSRG